MSLRRATRRVARLQRPARPGGRRPEIPTGGGRYFKYRPPLRPILTVGLVMCGRDRPRIQLREPHGMHPPRQAQARHGGWTARQERDAAAGGGRLRASSLPVELACCWASGRQPRRRIRQQERSLTPPEPASQVQSCSVVVHDAAAAYLLILMQAPS